VLAAERESVQQSVDSLMKTSNGERQTAGYGGRVTKYKHRFCNTEFVLDVLKAGVGRNCLLVTERFRKNPPRNAIAAPNRCVNSRNAEEWSDFANMMTREDGLLSPASQGTGARESRYAHLFQAPWNQPAGRRPNRSKTASGRAQIESSA